jgi:hypothetical protein
MGTQRTVQTVQELGDVISAVRIAQGLRTDELSSSHVFVGGIERGKPTAQVGKVLELLGELGIRVTLELPPGIELPNSAQNEQKRRRRRRTMP